MLNVEVLSPITSAIFDQRRVRLCHVCRTCESGSDETLKRMNKGGSASTNKTLEIAEKMRKYGIVPEFSFVLGNPPDPEADVRQTLEFIRKVKRVNPHTEIIMYVYTPVPLAGELYEENPQKNSASPFASSGLVVISGIAS